MDIIRRKVFNLHSEKDVALVECSKQEQDVKDSTERAKEAEALACQLAKKVGKLENDLEDKRDALALSLKTFIEKDKGLYNAQNESVALKNSISEIEERLRVQDEEFDSMSVSVNAVSSRADEFEKIRKDLENNISLKEDHICTLGVNIREARFLEEDAIVRTNEAEKKTDFKKAKLETAYVKGDSATEKISSLEDEFKVFAKKMIDREVSQERSGKRLGTHKRNIQHLTMQLAEANKRADCEEADAEKLQFRIDHITHELQRLRSKSGSVKKGMSLK
eukprot:TRINITY_DN4587_c0_g1_i1.p1 TRINITY_DN4587_c0_g1~~TRINITY_DN4587_c0_g1_i1.p1  ORF type:complete len:278 (-),score=92.88 TRINITY_DN4587_c0_g1_i1:221-1054(-)